MCGSLYPQYDQGCTEGEHNTNDTVNVIRTWRFILVLYNVFLHRKTYKLRVGIEQIRQQQTGRIVYAVLDIRLTCA